MGEKNSDIIYTAIITSYRNFAANHYLPIGAFTIFPAGMSLPNENMFIFPNCKTGLIAKIFFTFGMTQFPLGLIHFFVASGAIYKFSSFITLVLAFLRTIFTPSPFYVIGSDVKFLFTNLTFFYRHYIVLTYCRWNVKPDVCGYTPQTDDLHMPLRGIEPLSTPL